MSISVAQEDLWRQLSGKAAVMEVATTRSILTLQPINVIGLPFIHSKINMAATLMFPKRYCSVIQKRCLNGSVNNAGARAHF